MTMTSARRWSIASSATVALVVCGALTGCSDDSGTDARTASSTTVAPSSATSTTVKAAELQPVQVARDFLDAYSDGDADRALAYLTEDATGGGYTNTMWESSAGF